MRIAKSSGGISRCGLGLMAAVACLFAGVELSIPRLSEAGESELREAGAILPPLAPWDGPSRSLAVGSEDPWQTPAEASGLKRTPSYEETFAWLEELADATQMIQLLSIGRSYEGRDIWMAVVSTEAARTPAELHASGHPVLLAHGGIHSGEIDGKDAGLMLLRDLTVGGRRSELLDSASLLFIPILNVDGHERASAIGRVNQRGPERMGWRTNARNQNLNRDFAKLDTPELQALIGAIETWSPDLYLDLHVTDGADYQYDITWGYNGPPGWSPRINAWLERRFDPLVAAGLTEMGHVPGPLIFARNWVDFTTGLRKWSAGPRFSNGYGDARHLPTVLVENHSLKPFDRRVLGTYVLLDGAMRALGRYGEELREAIDADRSSRPDPVTLGWEMDPEVPAEDLEFKAISSRAVPSWVMGTNRVEWTGEPVDQIVSYYRAERASTAASRPAAYWIPPAWPEVIQRLELHGIELERLAAPREVEVEMYRLTDAKLEEGAFEGRVRLNSGFELERRRETFPVGSARIPLDQDLGTLAALLLEPASADSFLQAGFFHEILQRTEYMESYLMDDMVAQLLEDRPELREEFERKVAEDETFAASPRERMTWFYERSPYVDERWLLYPVAREPTDPADAGPDS